MNKISWNLPVALELHTLRYPSTSTFLNPCIHQWNHISTMTYYKQFTRRLTSQHFYRLVKYLSWLQVIFPQNGSLHSSSSDFISQHTKGENLQYLILYTRHGIFVQSFKYFTRFMRSPCDLQYEYVSRACYIAKEIHWYFEDKHFCLLTNKRNGCRGQTWTLTCLWAPHCFPWYLSSFAQINSTYTQNYKNKVKPKL